MVQGSNTKGERLSSATLPELLGARSSCSSFPKGESPKGLEG